MKKILTASLVAMLAVTAANADIASTQYVDKAKQAAEATATSLNNAMDARVAGLERDNTTNKADISTLKNDVAALGGDDGSISKQIGDAIGGLDVDEITVADGKYVKTVSETDGKVSVTTGDLVSVIDANAKTSSVAPTTKAVVDYVGDELGGLTNNVDTLSGNLSSLTTRVAGAEDDISAAEGKISAAEGKIAALETNSATKTELSEQNQNLTAAIDTAKTELQGKINDVVAGGLSENSVEGTAIKTGTISEAQLNTSVNASLDLADSALQKDDITTGKGNGTISVEGSDVAVAGLGSAAYTDAGAYATAAQGTLADGALPKATYDNQIGSVSATNMKTTATTVVEAIAEAVDEAAAAQTTANAAQTTANNAMNWNALKDATWTNAGCGEANAICSLVSDNGTISWQKVVDAK